MSRRVIALLLVLFLAACGGAPAATPLPITLVGPDALPTSEFDDPVLRQGQANYDRFCAHCHGFDGEGQLGDSAAETREMGMKIVPAHNSTGVIWQYADQILLKVTRDGVINALNRYPMPAFNTTLTDEEIMGVYAYIKTWWTPEQRAYQEQVTTNLQKIYDELGVDLTPENPFPTVTPAATGTAAP